MKAMIRHALTRGRHTWGRAGDLPARAGRRPRWVRIVLDHVYRDGLCRNAADRLTYK